jgi:hypothetical protein
MEWIKATRRSHERYTLTGSDAVQSFKVADSEFPARIYRALPEYVARTGQMILREPQEEASGGEALTDSDACVRTTDQF